MCHNHVLSQLKKRVDLDRQTEMATVREEAQKLLNTLPDEASWDDLMYEIYVRKKIDAGIEAADSGKLTSQKQVRRRFQRK